MEYKKYRLTSHTGYCGMDSVQYVELPADMTQEQLDEFAYLEALDNAEMYGIYPLHEYDDLTEEELESGDYVESIEGCLELLTPEDPEYFSEKFHRYD